MQDVRKMTDPTVQSSSAAHRRPIRAVLRAGIALGLGLLTDIKVEGQENLPKEGPLLVVGNHFNFLDPVIFIHILPYANLEFIGGRQAPNAPGMVGWIRNLWGILPVSRGGSSRDALLRAQNILIRRGVLAIFPEGGSWAQVLRPPRAGAALLAARSGARVLPIGLDGVTEVFKRRKFGTRARVTVRIGKPFGPFTTDPGGRLDRAALDDFGHEMMRQIAALLPADRRGYYSDDPAIREAARGTEIYPWENTIEV